MSSRSEQRLTEYRNALCHAITNGDPKAAENILFKLSGAGIACERLALLNHRNSEGDTVIDIAQKAQQTEITKMLSAEKNRMEFFE